MLLASFDFMLGLRVLNTPKYDSTKSSFDGFAMIANPTNVSASELTICTWVLGFYKE